MTTTTDSAAETARDDLNGVLGAIGISQRAFLSGRYRPERVMLCLSAEAADRLRAHLAPDRAARLALTETALAAAERAAAAAVVADALGVGEPLMAHVLDLIATVQALGRAEVAA